MAFRWERRPGGARLAAQVLAAVTVAESLAVIDGRPDQAGLVDGRCPSGTAYSQAGPLTEGLGMSSSLWWLGAFVVVLLFIGLPTIGGWQRRAVIIGAGVSFVTAGLVTPFVGHISPSNLPSRAVTTPAYAAALLLLEVCLLALAYVLLTWPRELVETNAASPSDGAVP